MRQARKDVREDLDKARNEVNAVRKEMADARREISRDVETLKKEVDNKIQKAIDNPLAKWYVHFLLFGWICHIVWMVDSR